MADIGIRFGVVRERIRQFAVRLNLPPRGRVFMEENKKRKYGFPYRHKPLSDYLSSNGIRPKEFARKMGKSYAWINGLLNLNRPITTSTALEINNIICNAIPMEQLLNPLGVTMEQLLNPLGVTE
jgi:hypothetical protein